MTAQVFQFYAYECEECQYYDSSLCVTEDEAQEEADQHDAEFHDDAERKP
jgi:hypothetical protein